MELTKNALKEHMRTKTDANYEGFVKADTPHSVEDANKKNVRKALESLDFPQILKDRGFNSEYSIVEFDRINDSEGNSVSFSIENENFKFVLTFKDDFVFSDEEDDDYREDEEVEIASSLEIVFER